MITKEQRSKHIYISGPMTGYPELNYPAFNTIENKLLSDGWLVENPATIGVIEGAEWDDYMAASLLQIGKCGAMYMLKGWQMSRGACLEQLIAHSLNFKIIYEDAQ